MGDRPALERARPEHVSPSRMTLSLRGGDFKTLFPTPHEKGAEELLTTFLETQFAGAAHQLGAVVGVAVDAVPLLVELGQLVAALAVVRLAGGVVEARRSREIGLDAEARRVDPGGVEAAEGVVPLAGLLRELAPRGEVLLHAVADEVERSEESAGASLILIGVDIVVVGLAMAGILENLRGACGIFLHADAVAVRAPEVDAGSAVRGLAARAVAAAAIELNGAL